MARNGAARRNLAKSSSAKASGSHDDRVGAFGGCEPAKQPAIPRHIPMPDIPTDGDVLFELTAVIFGLMYLACQYLNLYHTVWWLPHAHNDYAIKYHLIDPYVTGFSVIIICRRLPYIVLKHIFKCVLPNALYAEARFGLLIFCSTFLSCSLLLCTYMVCLRYGPFTIVCLIYPAVIYFVLFRTWLFPLMELLPPLFPPVVSASTGDAKNGAESTKTSSSSLSNSLYAPFLIPYERLAELASRIFEHCTREQSSQLIHVCSVVPNDVRAEVEIFKSDFNARLKLLLYNSLVTSYYASFQPCFFMESHLHVDMYWLIHHGVFSWLGAVSLYACYYFPPKYLDALHKCALHLGKWQKLESRNVHAPHHIWSEHCLWPQNNLVKCCKEYFKAQGLTNAAEPGNYMHSRFYSLFHNPMKIMFLLLSLILIQIAGQFYTLLRSRQWNCTAVMFVLLVLNSLTLFKTTRQYLVSERVYTTERLVHEKLNSE